MVCAHPGLCSLEIMSNYEIIIKLSALIISCIKTKNSLPPSVHHFFLASLLELYHFVVQLLDVTLADFWRTCGLIQPALSLLAQLLGH